MKQLPNFDLSLVIPLGNQIDAFVDSLPSNADYYERNGIEVVLLIDGQSENKDLLDCIRKYPFISWKVIVCSNNYSWENWAQVCNEGIRQATKKYIQFMYLKSDFQMDVIYELREKLDEYPEHYAIGSSYGNLMVKKEYLNLIGGFDERFMDRKGCEENLCRRLELIDICRLFFPTAILHREESWSYEEWQTDIPDEILLEMLLPVCAKIKSTNHSNDSGIVIYDWEKHPYAQEQCQTYLSGLKQFDISTNEVFEKSYPLVALIPTYNESERIMDCLRSVEKYCDAIILLDDDSADETYQIVYSEKLLVKAKKDRKEFNDKQNRNILLNIASFFKAEWFIFIDADERFDDRFVDLREKMELAVDTIGIWIVNLWDSLDTYRVDMEDSNPLTQKGLWFRWRMFRNKGRMLIINRGRLHFSSVPYNENVCVSRTLVLHLGYLNESNRKFKRLFYQRENDYHVDLYYKEDDRNIELMKIKDFCFELPGGS